ncbi:fatty acid desaturase [Shimia isoporae]|uniref:Fatty acid desaturase n=1 Tax=Shimia isoporae TaxID=647720 RepID=A0A4R1NP90_9RHOB|nr:fatty acid desaturase [Shimia isoporae]TCL10174.1 fatty acid desaturase [Shimia isoporae]
MADPRKTPKVEWPTLGLVVLCYVTYALGTVWVADWFLPLGMALTVIAMALHSSLSHEVLHGHPFQSQLASEALVFPAVGLCIPYLRFRDTHLAHHKDSHLTDPYDDPETNFLDPKRWARMPRWLQLVHDFNNTLLGRLMVGPLLGQLAFMRSDAQEIARGNTAVLVGWLLHVPAVAIVVWWLVAVGQMPVWAYLLSAYCALSILKIRTFLEHQAHAKARGRTVIIDDRGPLAWIFLNNNLHVVHHMHPRVPWYRLPILFRENRGRYLMRNEGYYFRSYAEVFRRFFLKRKDPVPHPLWGGE